MTEQEDLACTDPSRLLRVATGEEACRAEDGRNFRVKASDRKLRLFAAAVNNQVCEDGDCPEITGHLLTGGGTVFAAGLRHPDGTVSSLTVTAGRAADLLREIVGNPFRPPSLRWRDGRPGVFVGVAHHGMSLSPTPYYEPVSWLAWNDGAVSRLAAAIYQGRLWDECSILADCLCEAGAPEGGDLVRHLRGFDVCPECLGDGHTADHIDVTDLTGTPRLATLRGTLCPHCRGTGWTPKRAPWVRGSWSLDAILGKE